jgi:hypothetical protein
MAKAWVCFLAGAMMYEAAQDEIPVTYEHSIEASFLHEIALTGSRGDISHHDRDRSK